MWRQFSLSNQSVAGIRGDIGEKVTAGQEKPHRYMDDTSW